MPKKLLIVEDEPDMTRVLTLCMKASDAFLVESAENGEAGLALARLNPPDAILLDIQMPKLDGWEFCRRLDADPRLRDIPVVMMTAAPLKDADQRAIAARGRRVVIKPFDLDDVLSLLREAVGERP